MNSLLRSRTRAMLATALTGALAILALGVTAASAEPSTTPTNAYPPPSPCATSVLTGTFAPGATLEIESTGFTPNAPAEIWLHSTPVLLSSSHSDATGTITATVHIPADLTPGQHTLEVKMPSRTCSLALTSNQGVEASNTARNQPSVSPDTSSHSLAFTGFSAITSLAVVVVLLVSGLVFLVLGRRRRT